MKESVQHMLSLQCAVNTNQLNSRQYDTDFDTSMAYQSAVYISGSHIISYTVISYGASWILIRIRCTSPKVYHSNITLPASLTLPAYKISLLQDVWISLQKWMDFLSIILMFKNMPNKSSWLFMQEVSYEVRIMKYRPYEVTVTLGENNSLVRL